MKVYPGPSKIFRGLRASLVLLFILSLYVENFLYVKNHFYNFTSILLSILSSFLLFYFNFFFSLLISLFSLLIFIFFFFFAVLSQDPRQTNPNPRQTHGKQTQRPTANKPKDPQQPHGEKPKPTPSKPKPRSAPRPKPKSTRSKPKSKSALRPKPKPTINPNATRKSTEERGELWRDVTVTRATKNRGGERRKM